jgi:hypothetical protein
VIINLIAGNVDWDLVLTFAFSASSGLKRWRGKHPHRTSHKVKPSRHVCEQKKRASSDVQARLKSFETCDICFRDDADQQRVKESLRWQRQESGKKQSDKAVALLRRPSGAATFPVLRLCMHA